MTVVTEFGKITASKRTLAELVCVLINAVEANTEHGFLATAENQDRARRQIFVALDAVGYYDEVKGEVK